MPTLISTTRGVVQLMRFPFELVLTRFAPNGQRCQFSNMAAIADIY